MDAKTLSIWIALLTAFATGVARAVSLEERAANTQSGLVDVRGYLTAAEQRITAIENSRRLEEKLQQLELRIATIEERTKHR